MIKISLDEAYVFDLLSIFQVKINNFTGEKLEKTINTMSDLIEEIQSQIGSDLYNEIVSSTFYSELVAANQYVFDLVDQSKDNDNLAKITDDANFARHIKKMALQKHFFKNDLTEFKNRN
jgi:hypothetical protein